MVSNEEICSLECKLFLSTSRAVRHAPTFGIGSPFTPSSQVISTREISPFLSLSEVVSDVKLALSLDDRGSFESELLSVTTIDVRYEHFFFIASVCVGWENSVRLSPFALHSDAISSFELTSSVGSDSFANSSSTDTRRSLQKTSNTSGHRYHNSVTSALQ